MSILVTWEYTINFCDKKLVTQQHFVKKKFHKEGPALATDQSSAKFRRKNFHNTQKSAKFVKVFCRENF